MIKHVCIFLVVAFVFSFTVSAEITQYSGDDQIDEIQKRIDEEKERQKNTTKDDDDDDDDDTSCFAVGKCLFSMMDALSDASSDSQSDENGYEGNTGTTQGGCLGNIGSLTYAPFPYAGDWGNTIAIWNKPAGQEGKPGFLKATFSGAYLLDNIGNLNAQLEANLFILHFNGFYQHSFAETRTMNMFSFNGGVSFPIESILLNLYGGIYYYDYIGSSLISFGASMKIFLPHNLYLDVYNLNSFFGTLGFHFLTASLNYSLDRFSIGCGYRFNSFAGVILQGVEANISVWL
ncbi:MAG: hypothetical protein JW969_05410 [Spirochaetales bacterium]|nr:hypothetical protein [Spirochaetales bacterium]